MLSESLGPEVKAAIGAINRDIEQEKQGSEFVDELSKRFDFDKEYVKPKRKSSKTKRLSDVSLIPKTMFSIENCYPWKNLVLVAAESLLDAGFKLESKTLFRLVENLPTGYLDGKRPDEMASERNLVREARERILAILNECLGDDDDKPIGNSKHSNAGRKSKSPAKSDSEIAIEVHKAFVQFTKLFLKNNPSRKRAKMSDGFKAWAKENTSLPDYSVAKFQLLNKQGSKLAGETGTEKH